MTYNLEQKGRYRILTLHLHLELNHQTNMPYLLTLQLHVPV